MTQPNLTLTAFLSSLSRDKKNTQSRNLIELLAKQTLDNGLEPFMALYENSPPDLQDYLKSPSKTTTASYAATANQVIKKICSLISDNKGITQEEYEFFKKHELLNLQTLLSLKNKKNFIDTNYLVEKLIQDKTPKDDRFVALREFMEKYKECYDKKEVFPPQELQDYTKRLHLGVVEKSEVKRQRTVATGRTPAGALKFKKETYTRKVKTENQHHFDKMIGVFVNFMTSYIQPDFLKVLDMLDLDFVKTLEKVSKLSPLETKTSWQNMVNNIDLKEYYDNLKDNDKLAFKKTFCAISSNIYQLSAPKNSYSYYSRHSININLDKSTQDAMKSWIDLTLALKKADFSYKEIQDTLNIFTTALQKTWNSTMSASDIIIDKSSIVKTQTKEKKAAWEAFKTEVEKDRLEKALSPVSNIKKIKIHKI